MSFLILPSYCDVKKEYFNVGLLVTGHFLDQRFSGCQYHLLLRIFCQNVSFGNDAQNEGILAVRELARPIWILPVVILLHEVHVVEGDIVELCVVDQGRDTQVVCSIHQGQNLDGGWNPPPMKKLV